MEFYCIDTIVEGGGTGGYLRVGGSGKAGESKEADARLVHASFHGTLQADSAKIYITDIPRGHRPTSYPTSIELDLAKLQPYYLQ